MGLYRGTPPITGLFWGSTSLTALFAGGVQLWPNQAPPPEGGINVLYEGVGANDNINQDLTHSFPTPPPAGSVVLLIQGNDIAMDFPPGFTPLYNGSVEEAIDPDGGTGRTVRVMVSKLAGDGVFDSISIPYSGRPQPYIVYVLDVDVEVDNLVMWVRYATSNASGFYATTSNTAGTKALFVGGMRDTLSAQVQSSDPTYQHQQQAVSNSGNASICVAIAAGLKDIPAAGTSVLPQDVVWDFIDSTSGLNLLLRAL